MLLFYSQATRDEDYVSCFVKNERVNFAWMIIENILSTRKIVAEAKYEEGSRIRKEGLPYACHWTKIFEHVKVSFKGYIKGKVKSS